MHAFANLAFIQSESLDPIAYTKSCKYVKY